jgi:hypothetical protein
LWVSKAAVPRFGVFTPMTSQYRSRVTPHLVGPPLSPFTSSQTFPS